MQTRRRCGNSACARDETSAPAARRRRRSSDRVSTIRLRPPTQLGIAEALPSRATGPIRGLPSDVSRPVELTSSGKSSGLLTLVTCRRAQDASDNSRRPSLRRGGDVAWRPRRGALIRAVAARRSWRVGEARRTRRSLGGVGRAAQADWCGEQARYARREVFATETTPSWLAPAGEAARVAHATHGLLAVRSRRLLQKRVAGVAGLDT